MVADADARSRAEGDVGVARPQPLGGRGEAVGVEAVGVGEELGPVVKARK